jgi:hypothetical protein
MRNATRRLQEAAGAVPPEKEGEPPRCHVCGAPLEGEGVRGIARCGYCAADNVLTPALVSGASAKRLEVLDDYVAEVRRESGALARAFGGGALLQIAAVALAPFLCAVPTGIVLFAFYALGGVAKILGTGLQGPTAGNRYAIVEGADSESCIAWYNVHTKRWERQGTESTGPGQPVESTLREVPLGEIVGRRLRVTAPGHAHPGFTGVARRPGATVYFGEANRILAGSDDVFLGTAEQPKGAPVRVGLWGACLAGER